ncbi:HAD hydrolase-like protein [Streptomyces sp. DSM 44915]|uniref:HAD hydrolase-like protein n=1 Tax=Streptomyces chisholmiae TaxID=3075540 RepID=A0ABU2JUF8_9ACTN|nr:HAD family hydrolase [Streptomyces sp. DSM 44915]MDT0267833.1 HAD hydrolase-like protein [Streptomyces sp. DSM 44915]
MATAHRPEITPHLVWDWNGTLLHDIHVVLAATNAAFAELGIAEITLERYRELYCVPITEFYRRLLGRLPGEDEWEVLDATFHRHYFARADSAGLTDGAAKLLADWVGAGRTQSVCSLAEHDRLAPWLTRLGVADHFIRVDGNRGRGPVVGKAEQMARHLAAMTGVTPERVVVIGDATDDALAAAHAGAKAVLYTGGSHSRRSLARAGVPVVDSLAEAVALASEVVGRG